jgi:hypothetical protein
MPEIRCYDDVDQFGAETVDEYEELLQDCYHRLIEEPGSNIDDPDRGLGIEDMLSGPLDPLLKQRIEAELRKDERVSSSAATITEIEAGSFRIEIQIEVDESVVGLVLETDAAGSIRRVV